MTIDLWQSEEMQMIQLIIPSDAVHETISELGELGLLQFKDLNPDREAFSRTYASQVKRCNEMTRRLRFFHDQVTGEDILLQPSRIDVNNSLEELEAQFEELEKELAVINDNSERLRKDQAELLEMQLVLEKAGEFFEEARITAQGATSHDNAAFSAVEAPLLEEQTQAEGPKTSRLGFTAGTIDVENLSSFERLLFRATRGNMFLRHTDIGTVVDPNTNKEKSKAVFVVFYAGERAKQKISKTCEAYGANRYPFPEDRSRQREIHADVTNRLRELASTIEAGTARRTTVLEKIALSLNSWISVVRREKAIYHTMNKLSFDVTRQALVADAWAPVDARAKIQSALQKATETANATVGTIFQPMVTAENPPTYFKTTMFTSCFQGIVEAYGVARYREVNPTTFTLITFPFLFAVMFGDVGHAILLTLFALSLLRQEKALLNQKLSDTTQMMFSGRYVIFLMGLFSIFTGFMYNEFFSMPMKVAGETRFQCAPDAAASDDPSTYLNFRDAACAGNSSSTAFGEGGGRGLVMAPGSPPYAFGVDPVWHGTRTELTFLNSVKMKMSIVMGIVHMSLGILMSLFNNLYFRDGLSIVCEFIPQVIFLWSLFGYLAFLIIFKWIAWPYLEARSMSNSSADPKIGRPPDLFGVMINMVLSPGNVDCGGTCTENNMYDDQQYVQLALLAAAFIAVPVMLLPKPLIMRARHNKRALELEMNGAHEPLAAPTPHGHHEQFEFGEVFVHQAIHTIEFVLGAVSNTASYLRLWALSLAHSQLSAVIYDKVLMLTVSMNKSYFLLIGSFVWWLGTLLVLMGMESLSAFLHALRLHWVEYQNKFYHGDGILFAPFSFAVIDQDDEFLSS